jgi:DNA-binding NarL/FixJ family response regulator
MTRRNRKKRIASKVIISIDANYDDEGRSYKDIIDSGFDINNEIDELKSDGLDMFLSTLSKKQIKIVDLIMQGYSKDEIKEILGISEARYQTCIGRLRCFDTLTLLHDAN